MMLTRFDPFREFGGELRQGLNMLNKVFDEMQKVQASAADFVPAVNTRETDDAYYVEVDLPGVKKEDISIDVHDNVLSISGERKVSEERKEDEFYRIESAYGKFERSFSLPEDVDVDKIEAQAENGVLTIKIPKAQSVEKAPKKIEIK